jgi:hypothetical protein
MNKKAEIKIQNVLFAFKEVFSEQRRQHRSDAVVRQKQLIFLTQSALVLKLVIVLAQLGQSDNLNSPKNIGSLSLSYIERNESNTLNGPR